MSKYPAPRSRELIDELQKYVIVEPHPFVVDLGKSEGMWLATVDGNRIFDWAGYYGAKLIAHNHPGLYEKPYVDRLVLAANNKIANPDFLTPECLAYYRLLHSLAPRCMRLPSLEVYTVNSGAEAVENMMKYFINLHDHKQAASGRPPGVRRFVYFDRAFHGRTVFALNVTRIPHDPIITKDFHGFVPGNLEVPFPAWDRSRSDADNEEAVDRSLGILRELLGRYGPEIVGIIVEPIQGAGGHRLASKRFFQELARLAHDHGVYLGFDEVQTAGGQTGEFFATDLLDLPYPPQAIAAGKKLGNGVVYMLFPMKDHGVLDSTWGGTLADMVRFVQEMDIVRREGLIEQVPGKAAHLVERLQDLERRHPAVVRNVRGLGLYQGFSVPCDGCKVRLMELALEREDLLLLGAGPETVRLRPHLNVTLEDIDLLHEKLERVLAAVESSP